MGGIGFSEENVIFNGTVEEDRLLGNDSDEVA